MKANLALWLGGACLLVLLLALVWMHLSLVQDWRRQQALAGRGVVVQARVLEFLSAPGPRSLMPQSSVRYQLPAPLALVGTLPIGAEAAQQAQRTGRVAVRYLPDQSNVQALDGTGLPLTLGALLLGLDLFAGWAAWQVWASGRRTGRRNAGQYSSEVRQ
ncbi:hypothetical protein [Deinococcus aquatilis]|uniref:hypothetical protein n=1 Tax=Deinococcus aquatilis TaxID=519440 RepID=UPI000360EB8F|nr:hypothetical protein [Deinococcus aquatilis]